YAESPLAIGDRFERRSPGRGKQSRHSVATTGWQPQTNSRRNQLESATAPDALSAFTVGKLVFSRALFGRVVRGNVHNGPQFLSPFLQGPFDLRHVFVLV